MKLYPITIPGGSDTYVQYNNGGIFGGDSTFNFNDTTKVVDMDGLTITGTIATGLDMSGGTFATAIQNWPTGTIHTDQTITITDPTATTGKTSLILQAGAGNTIATEILSIRPVSGNAKSWFSVDNNGTKFVFRDILGVWSSMFNESGPRLGPSGNAGVNWTSGDVNDPVDVIIRRQAAGAIRVIKATGFYGDLYIDDAYLWNRTHEDTDGGRETAISFRGEQSGGEDTTLARIEASHVDDGVDADDEKGQLAFYTNADADGDSPTLAMHIDEAQTLVFDDTVWGDANVGAAMLSRPAASQPSEGNFLDEGGGDTGITTLAFAVGEHVSGTIEIPHDYKEGTDLYFHVHWQGAAAPSGTDYVKWQVTYTVGVWEETLDAAGTEVVETAMITQYDFKRSDFPAVTGTNYNMGDQVLFDLERIAAVGDAYAGTALIATVGFHYEKDTVGSRGIVTK